MAAHSFQPGHAHGAGSSSNSLSLNLSSNNPFRNRAASPASLEVALGNKPASPASPFDDPPPRPLSRNPFLDQAPPPLRSPGAMSTQSDSKSLSAEEIFDSLTLDEKPRPPPNQRRPTDRQPGPRRENLPPPGNNNHRPSRSQEEALKARRMQAPPRPGPPQSPKRQEQRRARRNSESSLMDFDAQPLTEEEKRMIEAARRAKARQQPQPPQPPRREAADGEKREAREPREGREGKDKSKSSRPNRRVDIIDQLDATGIYGTGLFHHDGPFDALNPHRNRKNASRAPMQAFPKDSLNNSLGGAGPLNSEPDHATFMGLATDEAFTDYAVGRVRHFQPEVKVSKKEGEIFNATSRVDLVHGDESHGLGTSTFLEGTPAARSAIARHRQEQAQAEMANGLQRKKSLAQRIRHINKGQREFSPSGRMTNPEGAYNSRRSPDPMPSAASNGSENNPFFSEYGKGEESISVRPRDGGMSPSSPPFGPRRGSAGNALERRTTSDTFNEDKPSGLLGRMKSLKGGRRPRNDGLRDAPPQPGTAA